MKAVIVTEFGGPEQLRLSRAAEPLPGGDQVRVAVRAAGVNPVDAGNRADGGWAGLKVPCILGYDIAGVIESTGPGVAGLVPLSEAARAHRIVESNHAGGKIVLTVDG